QGFERGVVEPVLAPTRDDRPLRAEGSDERRARRAAAAVVGNLGDRGREEEGGEPAFGRRLDVAREEETVGTVLDADHETLVVHLARHRARRTRPPEERMLDPILEIVR